MRGPICHDQQSILITGPWIGFRFTFMSITAQSSSAERTGVGTINF